MPRQVDLNEMATKEQQLQSSHRCRVLCCSSTACLSSGSGAMRQTFEEGITAMGLEEQIQVVPTGCMGLCSQGPVVKVHPKGEEEIIYHDVNPEIAKSIVKQHLVKGEVDVPHMLSADIPFFTRQTKIVLANAGEINPERIEEYIARGGYQALRKALSEMTPESICQEILDSGLRGRGGAGYPSGLKWNLLREAKSERKYLIANGDEGDPGAYMDRTIMEADPHRVIEGMVIAGFAVGAEHGYLYVRAEYPLAIQRLEQAIRSAKRNNLLGKNILGSNFSFNLEVRIGAGAFVCGEETALMASIEGRRGQPVLRPPYPTKRGLWGAPTMINNVETLANVAPIIERGAAWFASIGTASSKGTKVFALTGKLKNTGLIEVPMGITLHEIVYDIGGGIPGGRSFKAAQTGGPSGGCIPAEHLDTPVDYESLRALNSIMGSGGLVIMDDQDSMPEVAKFFMEFCMDESCGKCVPCRTGTVQMYQLLDKITQGRASAADLALLEELCDLVKNTSLCGLGQTAPNPVLSTLQYFRHEYLNLLKEGVVNHA